MPRLKFDLFTAPRGKYGQTRAECDLISSRNHPLIRHMVVLRVLTWLKLFRVASTRTAVTPGASLALSQSAVRHETGALSPHVCIIRGRRWWSIRNWSYVTGKCLSTTYRDGSMFVAPGTYSCVYADTRQSTDNVNFCFYRISLNPLSMAINARKPFQPEVEVALTSQQLPAGRASLQFNRYWSKRTNNSLTIRQ